MEVMIKVKVFWVVTLCSVVRHQHFGRPCCLHLWVCPKFWYPTTTLCSVKSQKTLTLYLLFQHRYSGDICVSHSGDYM